MGFEVGDTGSGLSYEMPLFICVLLVPEAHCDLQASQLQ